MWKINYSIFALSFFLLVICVGFFVFNLRTNTKNKELQDIGSALKNATFQLFEVLEAELVSSSASSTILLRRTNKAVFEIDKIGFQLRFKLVPETEEQTQQSLLFLIEVRALISELHLLSLYFDRSLYLAEMIMSLKANLISSNPNIKRIATIHKARLLNDLTLVQDKAIGSMELVCQKVFAIQNFIPYIATHFGDSVAPPVDLLEKTIQKMNRHLN